jgi:plastocyanin
MTKTSRRNLLTVAAAGGVSTALGLSTKPETAGAQDHSHQSIFGPLAGAVVSFGQWETDPALDRFPVASPGSRNTHVLIPNEATIQAGGAVSFVIAGLHQVIVYDNGTQPEDINTHLTTPSTGTPANVPLIDDSNRRIYRGLDPTRLQLVGPLGLQDRVESVMFSKPGRYLVICGVLSHFRDGMFGFVRVLP